MSPGFNLIVLEIVTAQPGGPRGYAPVLESLGFVVGGEPRDRYGCGLQRISVQTSSALYLPRAHFTRPSYVPSRLRTEPTPAPAFLPRLATAQPSDSRGFQKFWGVDLVSVCLYGIWQAVFRSSGGHEAARVVQRVLDDGLEPGRPGFESWSFFGPAVRP